MKILSVERKSMLVIVAVLIVLGALVQRENRVAGLVVSLLGIAYYIAVNFRQSLRYAKQFKRIDTNRRVMLLLSVLAAIVFLYALLRHEFLYFLFLVVLGCDSFVSEKIREK